MEKEEILKKSREEKADEGELHAQTTGAKWGYFGMTVMYIFLCAGLLIVDGNLYSPQAVALHAICWFGHGMRSLGYGISSRRWLHILFGIMYSITGIVYLSISLVELLRR